MTLKRLPIVAATVALGAVVVAGCGSTQVTQSRTTSWGVAMTRSAPVRGVADATAQRLCSRDDKVVIVTRSQTRAYDPAYPAWTQDSCDFSKLARTPYRDLPADPGFGTPISGDASVAGVADATSQQFCGPDGKMIVVTRSQTSAYRPAFPAWTGDPCHATPGLG